MAVFNFMAIDKNKKREVINELIEKFHLSKSVIFIDYSGMTASKMNELRNKLLEKGNEFRVAKKTLTDLALKETEKNITVKGLSGQLALVFGLSDEITPAQILAKENKSKNLKIIGGELEGKMLSAEEIIALSKIPPREVLLAQLVGAVKSPLTGLAGVLQGNLRHLIYCLKAISEKGSNKSD